MIFGRRLNTEVRQYIVGGKVEPEKVRPFRVDGEKLVEGGEVVDSRALGIMVEGRVFAGEAVAAVLANPSLRV